MPCEVTTVLLWGGVIETVKEKKKRLDIECLSFNSLEIAEVGGVGGYVWSIR